MPDIDLERLPVTSLHPGAKHDFGCTDAKQRSAANVLVPILGLPAATAVAMKHAVETVVVVAVVVSLQIAAETTRKSAEAQTVEVGERMLSGKVVDVGRYVVAPT